MMTLLALAPALLLVAVHWTVPMLRFLDNAPRSRWLSFAGGSSIAYVFLHLLPELAHGAELLSATWALTFDIWGVALISLLAFYGLERHVQRAALRREGPAGEGEGRGETGMDESGQHGLYRLHLASFAVYNAIVGYLVVDRLGDGATGPWTFAVAMALHLLVTDHGLLEAFREGYMRRGRWVLSAAVLAGWAVGMATEIPALWMALVMAALGGGVILNVLKEELPAERDSRFSALLLGAAAFAGLLWLAH
jgi:hypothetical protein